MKITILGCGSSSGVPAIGCKCPVCRSPNPKNKRLRVSVLVENEGKRLLIDTSPDLREQFLSNDLCTVDAIIYTHAHADHLHGIDDVRSINYYNNAAIPAYMDEPTLESIRSKFPYVFQPPMPDYGWYRPCMEPIVFTYGVPFVAAGMQVTAFGQIHGKGISAGLRIGDFAYSTDVNELPPPALDALNGVRVWVVDCLRYQPAPTHSHLERTLQWINKVKPEQAILTHMAHDFDYETLLSELPPGVAPAYDGLAITI